MMKDMLNVDNYSTLDNKTSRCFPDISFSLTFH